MRLPWLHGPEANCQEKTKMHRKPGRQHGFTLIELLVVIAIIMIIAAILFPVFASAREKGRQAVCASNEKQLGYAFLQYAQDYDETFPVDTAGGYMKGWITACYYIVQSKQVFTCPDDQFYPGPGVDRDSYCMNANLMGGSPSLKLTNKYALLSNLQAPALTVLLCEVTHAQKVTIGDPSNDHSVVGDGGGLNSPQGYDYADNPSSTNGTAVYKTGPIGGVSVANAPDLGASVGYHSGGSNYLACDGHVKWLSAAQVSGGQTPDAGAYLYKYNAFGTTIPASDPINQECYINNKRWGYATDTTTMRLDDGVTSVTMTFSPK